jgi:predicted N-acyltransferase
VRDGVDRDAAETALLSGALHLLERRNASSLHITFPTEGEWSRLGALGLLKREDRQYHWENEGYASFDDFLGALASRKRKAIRKERKEAHAGGLRIAALTGSDLTEAHWDAFYRFYTDTGARKWGRPYLNRRFFSLIGESMADRILLVMCFDGDRPIAGALNFIGADALYGRNWGAIEHRPCLHFEACYYQAIDFAIARGLKRVEAGAQGEHKLARGYLPKRTFSLHYIADPGLRAGVASYLSRERAYLEAETGELEEDSPYRKDGV